MAFWEIFIVLVNWIINILNFMIPFYIATTNFQENLYLSELDFKNKIAVFAKGIIGVLMVCLFAFPTLFYLTLLFEIKLVKINNAIIAYCLMAIIATICGYFRAIYLNKIEIIANKQISKLEAEKKTLKGALDFFIKQV
jgi:hypothetical protein